MNGFIHNPCRDREPAVVEVQLHGRPPVGKHRFAEASSARTLSARDDEKLVDYAGASVQQVLLDTRCRAADLERVGRFCWFEPSQPSYKFFDRGLEPETRYKPCIRSGRFETKP
jgi:hypothetical protein